MIMLKNSLNAWQQDHFADTFRQEVEALPSARLPLQQALTLSSQVSEEPFQVMLLNQSETPEAIKVKVGLFFTGIIAGCSCADDPTPLDTQNEYCELLFQIDKASAETHIELL